MQQAAFFVSCLWPGVGVQNPNLFKLRIGLAQKIAHIIGKNSDIFIFVANNRAMGNLSERDFNTYMDLFHLMMSMVKAPDLLIYLKSSIPHLVSQIAKRGRDYEKSISIEYLTGLNERYDKWISGYEGEVLTIDADGLDFQNRPEDFSLITDRIDARLYGLF